MTRRLLSLNNKSLHILVLVMALLAVSFAAQQQVQVDSTEADIPYCDETPDANQGYCWDRQDCDDETGLCPCRDGSEERDWRDCD
jgi:hypothetical protein